MPFLTSSLDAIDAFVTCVTHGLVLEVFTQSEAAKLLYAAQTAIAARRVRLQSDRTQPKMAAQQMPAAPSPTRLAEQEPTPQSQSGPTPGRTNAGGTNAGGPNAGGTNAGGTNAGGTPAGGTPLPPPPQPENGRRAPAGPSTGATHLSEEKREQLMKQISQLQAENQLNRRERAIHVPPTPSPFSKSGLRAAS